MPRRRGNGSRTVVDTTFRTWNATAVLRDDHKKLRQLFWRYLEMVPEKAGGMKARLFEAIQKSLIIHATIEEEIFYPAFEEESRQNLRVREIISAACESHRRCKHLLQEVLSMEPQDEGFDAKVRVLGEKVGIHIEEQEEVLHPIFEGLPKKLQNEVSSDLRSRKMELEGEYDLE